MEIDKPIPQKTAREQDAAEGEDDVAGEVEGSGEIDDASRPAGTDEPES